MKQKINSTDLHIQYKMEEAEWYQFEYTNKVTNSYHSTEGYSWEYARWIEEKYLNLYNGMIDKDNEIDKINQELDLASQEIISCQEIRDLKEELQSHWEKEAGADL